MAPAKPLPVDFDWTQTLSPTLKEGNTSLPISRSSPGDISLCSLITLFGSIFFLLKSFYVDSLFKKATLLKFLSKCSRLVAYKSKNL